MVSQRVRSGRSHRRALTCAQRVMTTRIQYHQIAAKLDYTQLKQKLVQLQDQPPPKTAQVQRGRACTRSRSIAHPACPRLELWRRFAKELTAAGLPIKPSRLRHHLSPRSKRRRPEYSGDSSKVICNVSNPHESVTCPVTLSCFTEKGGTGRKRGARFVALLLTVSRFPCQAVEKHES